MSREKLRAFKWGVAAFGGGVVLLVLFLAVLPSREGKVERVERRGVEGFVTTGPEGWVAGVELKLRKMEERLKASAKRAEAAEKAAAASERRVKWLMEELERARREVEEVKRRYRRPPRMEGRVPSPPRRFAEPVRVVEAPPPRRVPPPPPPPRTGWAPAGTVLKAVMASGVEAPTEGPPLPVLLVVKDDGLGPGGIGVPLRGCFFVGEAGGDLSSERVMVKVYRISCVGSDGRAFSREVLGYAAGPDGRVGIRGRLVSRQGRKVLQAFLANFFSGFGKGLASRETTTTQNLQTGYTAVTVTGDALRYALFHGAGKAAEELAKFLTKQAEKILPVVEVGAGTECRVVLLQGFDVPVRLEETGYELAGID